MSDDDDEEKEHSGSSGSLLSDAASTGDGAAAISSAASALRHLTVRHTLRTVVRRRWKAQLTEQLVLTSLVACSYFPSS